MIFLITLVILVVLAILDSNDKEKTVKPFIVGYNALTGEPIFNKESELKPIKYDIHTGKPIFEGDEEQIPEPPKVKTEEDKTRITNSILMITGAILIVFASIIFLATSWEVLSGIVKSLILVVIQLVFLVFYLICKNTFDLPKTSKVFKYLFLIFVPIVLLSLSCFEVVGDYLSISGDGFMLYFGASFILTDVIYKLINIQEKDKGIAIMSYMSEVLGIAMIAIHFIPDSAMPLLIVAIYNLIYYILIEAGIINRDYYLTINHINNYLIVAYSLLFLSIEGPTYIVNGTLFVSALYYFIKYYKNDDEMKQRRYMVYFLALYIASLTVLANLEVPPYFAYNLALIPLLLLTLVIKKDKLKNVLIYGILIISMLVVGRAIFDILRGCYQFNPEIYSCDIHTNEVEKYYLMTFLSALLLYVITYTMSKKGLAKVLAYSAFTLIFMEIFKIVELEELNKYIPLVTIVLVYFLEVLFENLKDKTTDFFLPALIMIESVVLVQNYAVLIPLIFMILYVYVEKKEEALLVLPMITSLSLFTMEDSTTSRLISYILMAIYSMLSINKKHFNVYTVVSIIALYYGRLVFDIHPITFSSILVLWSVSHLFVNRDYKIFKFTTITSVLVLYINIIRSLELDLESPYLFGAYLYLLTLTRYLFKEKSDDLKPFECIGIVIITLYGLPFLQGPTDAVIIIFSLLIVSILGFVMNWNHITYTGLACLVINIIFLTAEYWSQIPWYVYILIVGLALIIFAMLDEKRKLNKKNKEQEQVKQVDTK